MCVCVCVCVCVYIYNSPTPTPTPSQPHIPRHISAWLLGRRKVPHRLHFRLNIPRFFFRAVLIEFLFFGVKAILFLPGSPAAGSPQLCQYLHFCTGKASKMSTCSLIAVVLFESASDQI